MSRLRRERSTCPAWNRGNFAAKARLKTLTLLVWSKSFCQGGRRRRTRRRRDIGLAGFIGFTSLLTEVKVGA